MKPWLRRLLIGLGVLLLLLLVGPFLVPVPPLKGTVPPEQLADPDSRFIEVNGLTVHYKMAGEGEPAFFLLHGFGASTFSWREVMGPLAEMGTVVTFDRPAFGLTERPTPGEWEGQSPYAPEAQADLTVGLMDALGVERAVLVGNSAGGTVALLTALTYPERVVGLVLVDAAGAPLASCAPPSSTPRRCATWDRSWYADSGIGGWTLPTPPGTTPPGSPRRCGRGT